MKDTLQRARHEITRLRRANEILSAQMEVVQIFGRIANAHYSGGHGYCDGIDILHEIEDILNKNDIPTAKMNTDPFVDNVRKPYANKVTKPKLKKWSKSDLDEILELLKTGMTEKYIAKIKNYTVNQIHGANLRLQKKGLWKVPKRMKSGTAKNAANGHVKRGKGKTPRSNIHAAAERAEQTAYGEPLHG